MARLRVLQQPQAEADSRSCEAYDREPTITDIRRLSRVGAIMTYTVHLALMDLPASGT